VALVVVVVVAFPFPLQTMAALAGRCPAQQPAAVWVVRVMAGLALPAWGAKAAVAVRQVAPGRVAMVALVELLALVAVVVVALVEQAAAARVALVLMVTQEFIAGNNHVKLRNY